MTRQICVISIVLALAIASSLVAAQGVDGPPGVRLVKDAHPTLATGPLASARLVDFPAEMGVK